MEQNAQERPVAPMRVDVSDAAATYIRERGGTVWVWAQRPRMCCGGTPPQMKASTWPPVDPASFTRLRAGGIDIRFRAPGRRFPDVLEIAMHGKRQPRVEAYWDGCLLVM
jgi:hypothetical protein